MSLQPTFIPHDAPLLLDSAPEIPPSRWERWRARALREWLAWKSELSDWDKERAWLAEFSENRRREWRWFTRGTNQVWGFTAIAFWERISREDIAMLKHETNVAGKTAPSTFALILGAGVTLWIALHLEAWGWPLLGIGFVVVQIARVFMYLGSPMKAAEPPPDFRRRRHDQDEEEDAGWSRE